MAHPIFKNDRMPIRGYQILYLGLDQSTFEEANKFITKEPNRDLKPTIFKSIVPVVDTGTGKSEIEFIMDPNRLQDKNFKNKKNGSKWKRDIMENVDEQLNTITNPQLKSSHWTILKSNGGGVVQMGHQDFTAFTFPSYAGIVSLSDDCTLELPVKDYSNILAPKVIPKGYACIFRGDLWHAGSSYQSTSYRLYFKALPHGKVLGDEVWAGVFCTPTARIPCGCYKRFQTKAKLKEHRKICDEVSAHKLLKNEQPSGRLQKKGKIK